MSQLPPENPIETLRSSRQELEEVYKEVNHHFEELYPLPKQFIEQTAPIVDMYLKRFSKPGASDDLFVFQALMGFLTQFDDFALMANQVFMEYDENARVCKEYLEKISKIEELPSDDILHDAGKEFANLAPSVNDIRQRMGQLKNRSEEMVKKLEKIETRWNKIKTKIRA